MRRKKTFSIRIRQDHPRKQRDEDRYGGHRRQAQPERPEPYGIRLPEPVVETQGDEAEQQGHVDPRVGQQECTAGDEAGHRGHADVVGGRLYAFRPEQVAPPDSAEERHDCCTWRADERLSSLCFEEMRQIERRDRGASLNRVNEPEKSRGHLCCRIINQHYFSFLNTEPFPVSSCL